MIIKAYVKTEMMGSRVEEELEIADEELEGLDEEELTKYLEEFVKDWVYENIEWSFEPFGSN